MRSGCRQKRYPRRIRVAALMRQALCEILARESDIAFLTLHHVEIASDYSLAKVFYSLLDENPQSLEKACEHFASNAYLIRSKVAARLQMRSTPKLDFVYADDLRKAEKITNVITEIGKTMRE